MGPLRLVQKRRDKLLDANIASDRLSKNKEPALRRTVSCNPFDLIEFVTELDGWMSIGSYLTQCEVMNLCRIATIMNPLMTSWRKRRP